MNGYEIARRLQAEYNRPPHIKRWMAKQLAIRNEQAIKTGRMWSIKSYHSSLKATSDGKVQGYLVMFGSRQDVDLQGDYFTKNTDFGTATTTPIYYQHGMDEMLGKRIIGEGTLSKSNLGIWIDAQLYLRDEWEKAILTLVREGKQGWSSGTANHLVERIKRAPGIFEVTRWMLGLDASLTPTPAEPRIVAR